MKETKMIEVYDDLFEESFVKDIHNKFISPSFPWYLSPVTVPVSDYEKFQITEKDSFDVPFFWHLFQEMSKDAYSAYLTIPLNILDLFCIATNRKITNILRLRANLTYPAQKEMITPKHTDFPFPHYVFIYYVNDSDGNTIFYEGDNIIKEVEPKAGRLAVFDGSIIHAVRTHTSNNMRMVINLCVEMQ